MTDKTGVLTSNGKLDALIRRVNALIPDSVKPSTRISIHPCDWIELVNEIEDLQKRASPETLPISPGVLYMPCERHKSRTFSMTVSTPANPMTVVCPGCEADAHAQKAKVGQCGICGNHHSGDC